MVDPLAVTSLAPLAAALADPEVEIVFHDADYDLRLLDLEYGFGINNLFDTRIAAQLLNEPGVGLAALLEKYLGVKLDKRYQRADWSARPLSPEMLEYAAADTHHLPTLRDLLRGAAPRARSTGVGGRRIRPGDWSSMVTARGGRPGLPPAQRRESPARKVARCPARAV